MMKAPETSLAFYAEREISRLPLELLIRSDFDLQAGMKMPAFFVVGVRARASTAIRIAI